MMIRASDGLWVSPALIAGVSCVRDDYDHGLWHVTVTSNGGASMSVAGFGRWDSERGEQIDGEEEARAFADELIAQIEGAR